MLCKKFQITRFFDFPDRRNIFVNIKDYSKSSQRPIFEKMVGSLRWSGQVVGARPSVSLKFYDAPELLALLHSKQDKY